MELTPCTKFRQQQQAMCKKKHILGKQAEEVSLKSGNLNERSRGLEKVLVPSTE